MGQPSPSTDPMSLAGQHLGRYEVLTQLAAGGMATVYVARAQGVAGFERLVAVKVMHPHMAHEEEFISMFLDEARLAALIRHPNVVPTLDISDTDGRGFYLVMDYVEGDHLGALLRGVVVKRERLEPGVAVRIMLDALAGLGAAHTLVGADGQPLHLVHRDISPHNIIVGADGVSRLTDFGVAKAEVRLSSTRDGQFKGKLGYMAPEHASEGLADQRSDLFSMGIVLWESLASKRLFRGENNAATLSKVLNMPVPAMSDVAPELAAFDSVLARALARPPEDRFQSADEFLEALDMAARTGGMPPASARLVAAVVEEHVGEKLDDERARIREAIATYGASSLAETPLPRPSDGSASAKYRKGAIQTNPEDTTPDNTIPASPKSRADASPRQSTPQPSKVPSKAPSKAPSVSPPSPSPRGWLLPAVLLVLMLGLGAAAFAFLRQRPEEIEAPPETTFRVTSGREVTEAPPTPESIAGPGTESTNSAPETIPDPTAPQNQLDPAPPAPTSPPASRSRGARQRRGRMARMTPAPTAEGPEAVAPGPAMGASGAAGETGGDLIANPYTQ